MKQQAAHKATVSKAAGVETVHIYKNGTYDGTPDFDNHGVVQFNVDFPDGYDYCVIKLNPQFKKKTRLDGGTVKIEK